MNIVRVEYPLSRDVLSSVPEQGQSLAIGDFDGVHLGHREVIGRAIEIARKRGLRAAVMTFHPHPREVLGHPSYSTYLTPLERKLERFEEIGVDTVHVVTFNRTLAVLPPSAFIESVLKPLNVKEISVGFNFTFGHRGAGTAQTLREFAQGAYGVEVVNPVQVNGENVSSTRIREALSAGNVAQAATLLGRPFTVSGTVVRGEGRGRTIGVPTANLSPDEAYFTPAQGVYAVEAVVTSGVRAGTAALGVMNVGKKPTFHNDLPEPTWEAHLFDFSGDLYGERLMIRFRARIREERRFQSVDSLIEQIRTDIEEAKRLLSF